eukprot:gb/GECG01000848.1/.p1 GENE.gb/GECG01000848.1/~~gb/GECG01000848.1/.p1  ORF type:complete len:265 (+),score=41.02 gb/GECG01000848.1/:1-795(+)
MSSVPRNVTPWMSHGPRNIKTYLNWIKDEKKFLAPNLKELHLWKFASMKGQGHPSNRITFDIAKYHLLAFRWMNPNALVYLHEARVEEKTPSYAEFTLYDGRKRRFTINHKQHTPEMVLAKVMFAARDPAFDPPEFKERMKEKYEQERQQALEEERQREQETYELYQQIAGDQSSQDAFGERVSAHTPFEEEREQFTMDKTHPFERSQKWLDYPESIEDFSQKVPLWDTRPQTVKREEQVREIDELMQKHKRSTPTGSDGPSHS